MNARQLKNSILQMAVQGKLVPQDPNDEPASVLLERIRAEKQHLIKEGIIKKEKPLPPIMEDELPFEVPDNWEWVRLGIVIELITSGSRDWAKYYSAHGAKFVRMGNLSRNSFELRNTNYQFVSLPDKTEGTRTSLKKEDLLFSITGDVGLMGLIPDGFGEAYINQHTAMLRFVSTVRGKYLPYVLMSDYAQKYYKETQHGIKNSFRLDSITAIPVPLPPLNEQFRIVKCIEELQKHVAAYDDAEQKLTVLNAAFPDQLKKSILQSAVQGKLVPQDPNDEPASAILERIRAEKEQLIKAGKIKRDKHESIIFKRDNSHYEIRNGVEVCIDNELPFEIPDSWEWCTVAMLGEIVTGLTPKTTVSDYYGNEYPFYKPTDLDAGANVNCSRDMLSTKGYSVSRHLKSNSILVTCIGATIGKTGIIRKEGTCNQQINAIIPSEHLVADYIYYCCTADFFQKSIISNASSTTLPILNKTRFSCLYLPLPPLDEQHRIVKRIEELLPLIALPIKINAINGYK